MFFFPNKRKETVKLSLVFLKKEPKPTFNSYLFREQYRKNEKKNNFPTSHMTVIWADWI